MSTQRPTVSIPPRTSPPPDSGHSSARARTSARLRTPTSAAPTPPSPAPTPSTPPSPSPAPPLSPAPLPPSTPAPHTSASGPVSALRAYASLLARNPAFRFMFLGSFVSGIGSWFNEIATVVIIQRYSTSASALSLYFILRLVVGAAVSPLGGVLVDSVPKLPLLITIDALSAAVVLAYLAVHSASTLWIVYLNVCFVGALSAVFRPGKDALVADIVVDPADLELANALTSMAGSSTFALGSALGGVVTGLLGTSMAYVVDSLTFLISAAFLTLSLRSTRATPALYAPLSDTVEPPPTPTAARESSSDADDDAAAVLRPPASFSPLSWLSSFGAGVAYMVVHRPVLAFVAFLQGGFKFADASSDLMFTLLVKDRYSLGMSNAGMALGLAFVFFAIGIIIGPIAMRALQARWYGSAVTLHGRLLFMQIGFTISGSGFALIALVLHIATFFAGCVIVGVGLAFVYIQGVTLLQERARADLRGRVLSMASMVRLLAGAAGFFIASHLSDSVGWSPSRIQWTISVLPSAVFATATLAFRLLTADSPA